MEAAAPTPLYAATRMGVRLGERQRPEADVLVVDAPPRAERTFYLPGEVVLVAEVVSAESAVRDRETKPPKYAAARIRHFWRVERENGRVVVRVHEPDDTTGAYVVTGIHRGRLTVPVPFPLEIDLTTLYRR
ncbi:Uma2 family endonuclease [Streptomyces sp. TRM 70361]|uniref:Uma2 family endonuclease n=1 Tax=Streptomyces sp. TRM 70361 TaxID=3116553 RepID=UPI002E7C3BEE|nr:Uma2 family endonuclease [Streptomyces sp. TRM 70361]MEE1940583.1 Uma2 family endonuclease [Streptomyces sp. TRM 70361]